MSETNGYAECNNPEEHNGFYRQEAGQSDSYLEIVAGDICIWCKDCNGFVAVAEKGENCGCTVCEEMLKAEPV